jgi:hypothetical protein
LGHYGDACCEGNLAEPERKVLIAKKIEEETAMKKFAAMLLAAMMMLTATIYNA